jgi:hypothetical protein
MSDLLVIISLMTIVKQLAAKTDVGFWGDGEM